jgi:AraC-like DNA-binding protein
MQALSCPGDALALEVTQDFSSGIVAWRTGDAASRMASRTAQIETRADLCELLLVPAPETSSFTTAFRRSVGAIPSNYRLSVA